MNKLLKLVSCLVVSLPIATAAVAQTNPNNFGPSAGDREFSISGAGSSDKNFDSGSFGLAADYGWYLQDNMVVGVRQGLNYASIEGERFKDDFWNGSTRGYLDYQFGTDRARPFVGASLGLIYGDGVRNSTFAGLETGLKYYVLPSTYFLARVEYQWFFNSSNDANNTFSDGAFAHTVGLGYNF
ncbi:MAG: outer membrane beta-barrel protein [Marinospirillum sp.]|uniref:hypothetical protein n=1 Tax=Marinospirillum sp. TaxID=2183934 RepID=UPI0019F39E25|nr:hypothetical protein [Marinospirillum sp.]MBE0506880.1 outer membrane beta-barrel protein [Marinospirillum sp.]